MSAAPKAVANPLTLLLDEKRDINKQRSRQHKKKLKPKQTSHHCAEEDEGIVLASAPFAAEDDCERSMAHRLAIQEAPDFLDESDGENLSFDSVLALVKQELQEWKQKSRIKQKCLGGRGKSKSKEDEFLDEMIEVAKQEAVNDGPQIIEQARAAIKNAPKNSDQISLPDISRLTDLMRSLPEDPKIQEGCMRVLFDIGQRNPFTGLPKINSHDGIALCVQAVAKHHNNLDVVQSGFRILQALATAPPQPHKLQGFKSAAQVNRTEVTVSVNDNFPPLTLNFTKIAKRGPVIGVLADTVEKSAVDFIVRLGGLAVCMNCLSLDRVQRDTECMWALMMFILRIQSVPMYMKSIIDRGGIDMIRRILRRQQYLQPETTYVSMLMHGIIANFLAFEVSVDPIKMAFVPNRPMGLMKARFEGPLRDSKSFQLDAPDLERLLKLIDAEMQRRVARLLHGYQMPGNYDDSLQDPQLCEFFSLFQQFPTLKHFTSPELEGNHDWRQQPDPTDTRLSFDERLKACSTRWAEEFATNLPMSSGDPSSEEESDDAAAVPSPMKSVEGAQKADGRAKAAAAAATVAAAVAKYPQRGMSSVEREAKKSAEVLLCVEDAQDAVQSGSSVFLAGLVNAAHLNGQLGVVQRFESCKGKWVVRLDGEKQVLVRPENLQLVHNGAGKKSGLVPKGEKGASQDQEPSPACQEAGGSLEAACESGCTRWQGDSEEQGLPGTDVRTSEPVRLSPRSAAPSATPPAARPAARTESREPGPTLLAPVPRAWLRLCCSRRGKL